MKSYRRQQVFIEAGKSSGFTIVELVITILISSIMAIGVVTYIADSAQGIESAANRNRLAAAGQIALQQLSSELHNSLPNSIRVTTPSNGNQCIEFVPVRAATTYINPPFEAAGGTVFRVVDFLPSQHGVTGGYAVIYPNNQSQLYDGDNGAYINWPDFPFRGPIEAISSIADADAMLYPDQSTVTLAVSHRFRQRSPNDRFFVVEQPVSYCVKGSKLYRYTDYGFFRVQTAQEEVNPGCVVTTPHRCLPNYAAGPGRKKFLVTGSIDNANGGFPITPFSVGAQSLTRNSLVAIELRFVSNGESIRLNHEVLTRSVP